MSAHPYRKATLTAPETPRRGLRAALRDVLNRNAIGAWASVELCDVQAVRRALGGRWALVHARPSEALHPPLTWPRTSAPRS